MNKDVTSKIGLNGIQEEPFTVEGLTSTLLKVDHNKAHEAFKHQVDLVTMRNENATNVLMKLGGELDHIHRGKLGDPNNVNMKPTKTSDMYHQVEDLNMLHRRNVDEYPEYAKDGSFKRAIVDPMQSPAKNVPEHDSQTRTSLVNQASSMKAKNNAQYI